MVGSGARELKLGSFDGTYTLCTEYNGPTFALKPETDGMSQSFHPQLHLTKFMGTQHSTALMARKFSAVSW